MQYRSEIKNIETKVKDLNNRVGQITGEFNSLEDAQDKDFYKLGELNQLREDLDKAIELLTVVQGVTRDRIKAEFETLASWALKYVFQKDYRFVLVFSTRGNLQELRFAIQDPGNDEPLDPMDTRGGGVMNVVSLILRLILMEVSTPKIKGYILLDEALTNVNGLDNIERLNSFMEQLSKNFKRQIIHISDMNIFKEGSDYNLIEIK